VFLICAASLLLLMWVRPDWQLPAGWDYGRLFADGVALAFVGLLAWKYWQHRRQPPADDEPLPPPRRHRPGPRVPGDPRRP
jgi:hypothetical protein